MSEQGIKYCYISIPTPILSHKKNVGLAQNKKGSFWKPQISMVREGISNILVFYRQAVSRKM